MPSDITDHVSSTALQVCSGYICYDRGYDDDLWIWPTSSLGYEIQVVRCSVSQHVLLTVLSLWSRPSTSVSETCHNSHSDPRSQSHTHCAVNMHSCTQRHVKANRWIHIGARVCRQKHTYKNRKKKKSKHGNRGVLVSKQTQSAPGLFLKMCLYSEAASHTVRKSIREQQAVNELLLSATRSFPPLEGN